MSGDCHKAAPMMALTAMDKAGADHRHMGFVKVRRRDGRAAYACTDTCTGAPAVSLRVVAAIRISIASPSTSVACTVLPVTRIATD